MAAFVEAGGGVRAELELEFAGDPVEACGKEGRVAVEGEGEAGVLGHEERTIQERDAVGVLGVDGEDAGAEGEANDDGVVGLPGALEGAPLIGFEVRGKGLTVDGDGGVAAPGRDADVEGEVGGAIERKPEGGGVGFGEGGLLGEADVLSGVFPLDLGRDGEVDVEAGVVVEVEDVVEVGDGLDVGAGAAGPLVPEEGLGGHADAVVGVVEGAAVGLDGESGADAVIKEGLDPVAETGFAGKADEIAGELEAGPGAAGDLGGVEAEVEGAAE